MSLLFFIITLAMVAVILNHRRSAMILTFVALLGGLLVFWHHATNFLLINW